MNAYTTTNSQRDRAFDAGLQAHMSKVYGVMSAGLMLTFAAAWAFGTQPDLIALLRDPETLKPNALGFIVMFAPLAMIFFQGAVLRMSAGAVRLFFYAFSAVMGVSLSWIFVAYTGASIAQVFLITAIAFASLSLWGYTTKKDISGWGSFLIMGLIGIIIASIVNLFMQSSAMDFAVSVLGVLIFAGLTAYDTQSIKQTYLDHARIGDEEWLDKSATMGAFELYLDFVNLFVHLLRLLGNRN